MRGWALHLGEAGHGPKCHLGVYPNARRLDIGELQIVEALVGAEALQKLIVRADVLTRNPAIKDVLAPVFRSLDTATLQSLRRLIDLAASTAGAQGIARQAEIGTMSAPQPIPPPWPVKQRLTRSCSIPTFSATR